MFEFKERHVSVAIGLAFHGFDFIVDAFEFAVGYREVIPSEDAIVVFQKRAL